MADHYDVLGVFPDASDDDIRAAYLTRARALHPDRQQGRSPAERQAASRAMAAVNAAWSELSDPVARRRYDLQRVHPGRQRATPTQPSSTPPRRPPPVAGRSPHVSVGPRRPAGVPPEPLGSSPPRLRSVILGGVMPYIVLAAIGIGLFVVAAVLGGDRQAPVVLPEEVTCVTIPPNGMPDPVPCDGGVADGVILAEVGLSRVCPTGDRYEVPGGTTALCLGEP